MPKIATNTASAMHHLKWSANDPSLTLYFFMTLSFSSFSLCRSSRKNRTVYRRYRMIVSASSSFRSNAASYPLIELLFFSTSRLLSAFLRRRPFIRFACKIRFCHSTPPSLSAQATASRLFSLLADATAPCTNLFFLMLQH